MATPSNRVVLLEVPDKGNLRAAVDQRLADFFSKIFQPPISTKRSAYRVPSRADYGCPRRLSSSHRVGPAPGLPPDWQVAVLMGDPAKAGPYVERVKLPPNAVIPPHTHPDNENITVLSGSFGIGEGEAADKAKGRVLSAGSFYYLPANMATLLGLARKVRLYRFMASARVASK